MGSGATGKIYPFSDGTDEDYSIIVQGMQFVVERLRSS
jgi:hypothetical protein